MAHLLVRDVPESVHQTLVRRAQAANQSLQQYLLTQLTKLATVPSLQEVLDRIETHEGGRVGLDVAVADLDETRADQ